MVMQVLVSETLEGEYKPLEKTIIECIEDPLCQGQYLDINQVHFATNFGISPYTGMFYVINPFQKSNPERMGWKIPQLVDKKAAYFCQKQTSFLMFLN